MADNAQLQMIEEQAKWVKKQADEKLISLKYDDYLARKKAIKELSDKYDAIKEYETNLKFTSLPYEMELIKKDTVLKEKRERWHEDLGKDVYVEEAIHVLEDLQISNIKRKNKVALTD